MKRIRFAMIGGGWRSEFYLRAAKALPEIFEVTGVWMRDEAKRASYAARFDIPSCASVEELIATQPDFAIVSLKWQPAYEYSKLLVQKGIPAMNETPVAPDLPALIDLWNTVQETQTPFLCAEAYQFQPYYAALEAISKSGVLGVQQSVTLSMMHGYHAMNIARKLLDEPIGHATFTGLTWNSRFVQTCDRNGMITDGHTVDSAREIVLTEFEDGKTFQYDFCDEQYFSAIRTRYLHLMGSMGEIFDHKIRVFDGVFSTQDELVRYDFYGEANLVPMSHRGYTYQGQWVYTNPFPQANLTDDEISVAYRMKEMSEYLETGKSSYSLADACQDAYLSLLKTEAAKGKTVRTEEQPWFI